MQKSRIEQQVMASVGTIYVGRRLVSASALKLYACVAALYGVGQLVWVSRVFENLGRVGLDHAAQFMLSAVLSTDVLVQLALAVFFIAGFSLMRDLFRPAAPKLAF